MTRKKAPTLIVEQMRFTPHIAATFLRQNTANRVIRERHVEHLSREMTEGRFEINGDTIKVAEDEAILDGQHRLLACVDSGISFDSIVVYGLPPRVSKTIDTGVSRSGADTLKLNFPGMTKQHCDAVAGAVVWVNRIEHKFTTNYAVRRVSNTEVLGRVIAMPELWTYASTLLGYPKSQRLLLVSAGVALYHEFGRRNLQLADRFMDQLYTGESLTAKDVAHMLRGYLLLDRQRISGKLLAVDKVVMAVKAWNLLRRGKVVTQARALRMRPGEAYPVIL